MTYKLPIKRETRGSNPSETISTSLLGRGLAAIQSGNLPVSANYTEDQLLPILSLFMNVAFRLGYLTFKENSNLALYMIREECGKIASDSITIGNLQAVYINSSNIISNSGASSKKEVVNIESIEELYLDEELSLLPVLQELVHYGIQERFDQEIYVDAFISAVYYIKTGKRTYTGFSQAMFVDLGESIRPYLSSIYESIRHYSDFDNSGMDDAR